MPLSQAPHIPYGRPPPPREAFRNGPPPHYHSATIQGLPPPTFHGMALALGTIRLRLKDIPTPHRPCLRLPSCQYHYDQRQPPPQIVAIQPPSAAVR
ncbi:hypothetical protein A0H81_02616 [Grifola frondosa]|uniref:Uncharacterized protein n=1 Tax=Grifola frondosa TaxID=5627 RepID=A0A1C7MTW6_GRIFR|nr:hypothetical protein A0H81_02616 [Grifola frondosa]